MYFLEILSNTELRKRFNKNQKEIKFKTSGKFRAFEYPINSLDELASLLENLRTEYFVSLVLGKPKRFDSLDRAIENFKDARLKWLILDVDHLTISNHEKVFNCFSVPEIYKCSCICTYTSSYGIHREYSMRFFIPTNKPISLKYQKTIAKYLNTDSHIYQPNRLIFTADPKNGPPLKKRIFKIKRDNDVIDIDQLKREINDTEIFLEHERDKALQILLNAHKSTRNDELYRQLIATACLWIEHDKDPYELQKDFEEVAHYIGLGTNEIASTIKSATEKAKQVGVKKRNRDKFYELIDSKITKHIRSEQNNFYLIRTNDRKILKADLQNREFMAWMNYVYRTTFRKIPDHGDLTTVATAIIADISRKKTSPIHFRTADDKEKIIINHNERYDHTSILDGKYKYHTEGFSDNIIFVGVSRQGELPTPQKTDSDLITLIQSIFSNLEYDQLVLLNAWMLGALEPIIKYPILTLTGIHGSGKSTLAAAIKYWLDPNKGDLNNQLTNEPRDIRNLITIVANQHITIIDNVSFIGNELSDTLATISTGSADRKRALYTNNDLEEVYLRKPIIVTSINQVTRSADLADRSISIDLSSCQKNIDENILFKKIQNIRPYILDCIYQGLSQRSLYPNLKMNYNYRMGGWLKTAAAACNSDNIGMTQNDIYRALKQNRQDVALSVLETDSVANEIQRLIERKNTWIGTLNDLNDLLSIGFDRIPSDWPKTPHAFSRKIRLIEPELDKIYNIMIDQKKSNGKKIWIITDNQKDLKKFGRKYYKNMAQYP